VRHAGNSLRGCRQRLSTDVFEHMCKSVACQHVQPQQLSVYVLCEVNAAMHEQAAGDIHAAGGLKPGCYMGCVLYVVASCTVLE
jgi:hypothetical protein